MASIVEPSVEIEETNGSSADPMPSEPGASPAALSSASTGTVGTVPPPSRVRMMRPTEAALNAGIRPGERAPSPIAPPSITPRDRAERGTRVRERTPLAKTERLGTPGETLTPQVTYIPPPDAGRRRSRRTPTRGGRKMDGKGVASTRATSFLHRKLCLSKIASRAAWKRVFPENSSRYASSKVRP